MTCFIFDYDWIFQSMMIIKNENILFATILCCFLTTFIELFENLYYIFYLFIDIDYFVGEDSILVLEPLYFVGVELLCFF